MLFRSLYGNIYKIGGRNLPDPKIVNYKKQPEESAEFLSTNEKSFRYGLVGKFIRERFPNPSKYEIWKLKKFIV